MFTAAILLATLVPVLPSGLPETRPSLARQAQVYASAIVLPQQPAAAGARKDGKWDGALKGALAGAAIGAGVGLLTYGTTDGDWPELHVWLGAMTFFGTWTGAATGLIIDWLR